MSERIEMASSGGDPDADRANPWRRLTRRVAYENAWITVLHDDVTRPDGRPGIYGVVHFANLAIGVVALGEAGDVLLVGQYRYPLDRYSWEIPEGGGAPDETPLEAARRELVEETGYTAAGWRELLRADLSNSVTDEQAIIYLATGLAAGAATPEGTERIATRWASLDEALALVASGEIRDIMTIAALQAVALERSRNGRPGRRPG